jgi:hypothetical protein
MLGCKENEMSTVEKETLVMKADSFSLAGRFCPVRFSLSIGFALRIGCLESAGKQSYQGKVMGNWSFRLVLLYAKVIAKKFTQKKITNK